MGGGAAGFYGAIQAATLKPGLQVLLLEKSNKLLAKVKVSGGGRCNVTHHCFDAAQLSRHYPRGEKPLRNVFRTYEASKTVAWFESKNVKLKTEDDGRMFPITDSSQTIIDCLMQEAQRLKIRIEMGEGVVKLERDGSGFKVHTQTGKTYYSNNVLTATGGSPGKQAYDWIANAGHTIVPPIPSLFTFNDSEKKFSDLMGVAVPAAEVRIAGTKLSQEGPVLITHWGLSGPAVIKLSAWAAEHLHNIQYQFTALVSWIGPAKEDDIRLQLLEHKKNRGKQKVLSNPLFALPQRLWVRVCELADIDDNKIWAELPQKNMNRLMEFLIRCPFQIKGKTTFKEEFVTCGGVDLKEVDLATMQSKKMPGLYFAGEVLNIDGETGGFNFQAAWSTAYLAAKAISVAHW
ncbi:NAD(P)/FAD-dependent oxidoreductase [Fulvivirgaceae bacterium PWU4]|uniref:NAD(P)/FAD-dependent oxidoreductase n=1 Tax=Chryseosolibacter histidini TaxID=2782349 RepID=A0AAP2DP99_9BACT|nr:NAD(P)/FAD-dependent oxidoreductase [Chryseosolibacter histidini]